MGHSMRAVKPAAKRALIYLIVAAIMSGIEIGRASCRERVYVLV